MDRHLNIFNFFNSGDIEYLENNLSRAFAICLRHDPQFLAEVLRAVVPERLVNEILASELTAEIDLQVSVNKLRGFSTIIGVACSGLEIPNLEAPEQRETESPVTDVAIAIGPVCVLFEFKRTDEDCLAQLKRQAENARANCGQDTSVQYRDLSWRKIAKILHSLASLSAPDNKNPFTGDFIRYLEAKWPQWLPERLLTELLFPVNEDDPNYSYLNSRLNRIKAQIYGVESTKEVIGRYNRFVIKTDFGWINEIQIEPDQNVEPKTLVVRMHVGDTKEQGRKFFDARPDGVSWPDQIGAYPLAVLPYVKISNQWGSALLWIVPNQDEAQRTHQETFFTTFAHRYQRSNWARFASDLEEHIAAWTTKCFNTDGGPPCNWDEKVTNTNRAAFQLSVGTKLSVHLPFEACQILDSCEDNPPLVAEFRHVINNIRRLIDGH